MKKIRILILGIVILFLAGTVYAKGTNVDPKVDNTVLDYFIDATCEYLNICWH